MAKKVLTQNFSAPLDGTRTVKIDIDVRFSNLTVGKLSGEEKVLASGTLQYLDAQHPPTQSFDTSGGQAALTLRANDAKQSWSRLPWAACNAATEWQIHLNPQVLSDITVHSGGGNVGLDLSGLRIAGISAETGGGNMDVLLPDNTKNLSVHVKSGGGNVTVELGSTIAGQHTLTAGSGAGNVSVRVPQSIAARIHATSGLGKVVVDSRFIKMDDHIYQSLDYDAAADRVEITASTGAGNVNVITK